MNPEEDVKNEAGATVATNQMTPQAANPKDSLLYHIDREIDAGLDKIIRLRDLRRRVEMEKPHVADLIFQAKWILA